MSSVRDFAARPGESELRRIYVKFTKSQITLSKSNGWEDREREERDAVEFVVARSPC